MNEQPFFFTNNDYRLFGVLHLPENQPPDEGFVFCHPFAEEKLWTQRVYVNFARELTKRGYAVLRFDYMGHGDSDGDFENSSINSRLSDINCAIDILKNKVEKLSKVSLLGLRLGASLAAITAANRKDISRLVLWDPVTNGNKYMQEMLRINLTTQMATHKKILFNRKTLVQMMKDGESVDIDGYQMSHELYAQATDIDLHRDEIDFGGKSLIVQIGKENKPLSKDLEALAMRYSVCELAQVVEDTFWKEIKKYYDRAEQLYRATFEWVDNR